MDPHSSAGSAAPSNTAAAMVFARATATVLALLLGLLSLSLLSTTPVDAHASCCMKKLLPYIPDPDAAKPEVLALSSSYLY
jgi:hypothetical protein